MNIIFDRRNFDIEKVNSQLKAYCEEREIDNATLLKMQLISEEFLSNILFPNFKGQVEILIFLKGENKILTFEYQGIDYMNKVNEETIMSLKILEKQTEDITSTTINGITKVSFKV